MLDDNEIENMIQQLTTKLDQDIQTQMQQATPEKREMLQLLMDFKEEETQLNRQMAAAKLPTWCYTFMIVDNRRFVDHIGAMSKQLPPNQMKVWLKDAFKKRLAHERTFFEIVTTPGLDLQSIQVEFDKLLE